MKRVYLRELYYLTESQKIQVLVEGDVYTFTNVSLDDKDAIIEYVRESCVESGITLVVSKHLTIHTITARARA